MATALSYYGNDIDTSGWITGSTITTTGTLSVGGTLGTGDALWTRSPRIAATSAGTNSTNIFWDGGSVTGSIGTSGIIYNGDSTLTVSGQSGDNITVTYTVDDSGVLMSNPYIYVETKESKESRIKRHLQEIMKSNLLIKMGDTRQNVLKNKVSAQEIKARQTLRDLISERDWRRYLTNGFVIVQGMSGKFYQVFNDQRHIKVYVKGKLTDEICIHTNASECPPTDHILNMMTLIQCDENIIWTKGVGNVYNKDGSRRSAVQGVNGIADGFYEGNIAVQEWNAFVASGEDVPVELIPEKHTNLVDLYKRLKKAA